MVEPEVTLFGSKTTTAGQSPDRLVGWYADHNGFVGLYLRVPRPQA